MKGKATLLRPRKCCEAVLLFRGQLDTCRDFLLYRERCFDVSDYTTTTARLQVAGSRAPFDAQSQEYQINEYH
jgi:hypothetical protein